MACKRSLTDMGLDYVDLYLIHFPIAQKVMKCFSPRHDREWSYDPDVSPKMELAKVPVHETWKAMEALVDKGLAIDIGVSNFNIQVGDTTFNKG